MRDWIARAKRGDRAAQTRIVEMFEKPIYGYLLRLIGDEHEAEDLAQETFLRALTHLKRYDDRYALSTWLYTIAQRLAISRIKRRDVERPAPPGPEPSTPQDAVDRRETRALVRRELWASVETLSADQRAVILLFYRQQCSIEQIARIMDAPEGTVKSHLHRAKKRLKTELKARRSDWKDLMT